MVRAFLHKTLSFYSKISSPPHTTKVPTVLRLRVFKKKTLLQHIKKHKKGTSVGGYREKRMTTPFEKPDGTAGASASDVVAKAVAACISVKEKEKRMQLVTNVLEKHDDGRGGRGVGGDKSKSTEKLPVGTCPVCDGTGVSVTFCVDCEYSCMIYE